jgi:hypothetical protein
MKEHLPAIVTLSSETPYSQNYDNYTVANINDHVVRISTMTEYLDALYRNSASAGNHPEGNSYIERFHRSLKEEEVWTAGYHDVQEARASIAHWIQEYNHDRPHRGVQNRTPHEAFLSFAVDLKNQALTV